MNRKYLYLIGLLSPDVSFATQTLTLHPEQRLEAQISGKDMNRIMVEDDRISAIYGSEGSYTFEVDEIGGQVFLKTSEYSSDSINLTILTEKGDAQDIKLKVSDDASAETIIIKQPNKQIAHESVTLEGSTYHQMILQVLKRIANGEGDKAHLDLEPKRTAGGCIGDCIRILQVGELKGRVYKLTNNSELPLSLQEKAFYVPGDLALSLESRSVLPKTSTCIFVISSR